ncbi:unnamed protein product [Auanema sp. JU1783]|nr:unnamed protein product [Auanema sp. JU1783]
MKFDELLFSHIGEMGKYQKRQFLLVCLPTIIVSMHALSWTFAAVQVPFRCSLDNETSSSSYLTDALNITKCTKYDEPVSIEDKYKDGVECFYENNQCETTDGQCNNFLYYHGNVKYSAVERWDIVCSKGWIKAFIQSAYYVGQMAGSMIFGVLGDKIGRKKVFFLAIVIQITCGLGVAIAPTWWIYAVFRAGTGFSHPGIFVIAVVIGMELVGPRYRKLASVITGAFFALGQVLLGFEAWYVTDYRWLHLLVASPALLFLSYWWLVPESARWLVSQRRFDDADKVLQKAAKTNGVTMPENWWELLDEDTAAAKGNYGMMDLFKYPNLRRRTIVAFYLWPVVSMVYYGLAMKANVLGGDIYINFIFSALIEIPALVVVYLLIDRLGRRILLSGGFFIAGTVLIINYLLGDISTPFLAIMQMMISKGAITATYASLYTYSPELFPTIIRNTAMGCCSTIARIGAIAASFIAMWIVERYGKVYMIVPFGTLSIIAGLLTVTLLPETMGKPLPESIAQIEESATETEMQRLPTKPDEA